MDVRRRLHPPDYQQQPILTALEELIRMGDIELILPRTVLDEFARNKGRVVEESSRSLSGTMKRVKEAVEKFGPRKESIVLRSIWEKRKGAWKSSARC
jgi:hypothetical protein